jgi:hypothetical protein
MRKMQVPAYCPTFFGVHISEYTGVEVLVKNVMDIMDMDIEVVEVFVDDIDMPESISISAVLKRLQAVSTTVNYFKAQL